MRNRPRDRWIAALIALVVGLAGGASIVITLDDDGVHVVRKPSGTPTPAETQLPVTPNPKEFDGNEPGGAPLSSTDAPGKSDAQDAKIEERIEESAEEASKEDNADVEYDTSRVLEGAAGKRVTERKCHTPMNGGTRAISDIALGVGHVTVSRNLTGTRDGEAICHFFTTVKASATWIVDNEANSWENVSLDHVPWTQVFYNRRSCSIEYIGSTGRPGEGPAEWTAAQLREGGRLFAKCFALAKIPGRMAIIASNGAIVQSGFTTHQALGSLGGGHTDPGPFFAQQAQLFWIRHYLTPDKPDTAAEKAACARLRFHRQRVRAGAKWSDVITNRHGHRVSRHTHAVAQKRVLKRGGASDRHCR